MFGMGTGVAPPLESPEGCIVKINQITGRSGDSLLNSMSGSAFPADWPKELSKLSPDFVNFEQGKFYGQASRPISTGKLHALPRFHTQPIDLVVFQGSSGPLRVGISNLEVGFALICFQRLSRPNLAIQLCPWQDNWCTRGSSIPVLSY